MKVQYLNVKNPLMRGCVGVKLRLSMSSISIQLQYVIYFLAKWELASGKICAN